MAQRWDYEITEDGAIDMCEWWYYHYNACYWQAVKWHDAWLKDLAFSRSEEDIATNMRKVRWARAEMRKFEKEQEKWFEIGAKYGMMPF